MFNQLLLLNTLSQPATNDLAVSVPMPTFEGTATDWVNSVDITVPVIAFSGTASNFVAQLEGAIPVPTFEATGGLYGAVGNFALTFPVPEVLIEGLSVNGSLSGSLPMPDFEATGEPTRIGSFALELPTPTFAADGYINPAGSFSLTLPTPRFSATGHAQRPASLDIILPIPIFRADGYINPVGSFDLILPLPEFEAAVFLSTASTIAVNMGTGAVTEYTGFGFNSYCVFNGKALAASTLGIVELGGDTDNGTEIAASFATGVTDFGEAKLKRIVDCYYNARLSGAVELTVTPDEGQGYAYPLSPLESTLRPARAKIGKGLKGRNWQVKVANIYGADFEIDSLDLRTDTLSRGVG